MNKFLVANDDGINALGIQSLIKRLSLYGEVYVCAPSDQRSCMSQSMTLRKPISVEPVEIDGTVASFSCSGTPADCIKFGIQWTRDHDIEIDYVFSGVNHGANGGTDIRYSGTMGAAMEGAMSGIRSIAMSVFSHEATEFEFILDMIPEILEISKELPKDVVLNVNSPNLPKWKIKGVKMVSSGPRSFLDRFIISSPSNPDNGESIYPDRKAEYKYEGKLMDFSGTDEEIDLGAIAGGYATITPIKVDTTDYESLIKINKLNEKNAICLFMNYQEKLIDRIKNSNEIIDRTKRLAKCADILNLKIIYSKHFAGDLGDIPDELSKLFSKGKKVETVNFDLFDMDGFYQDLIPRAKSKIVILGLEAHVSLLQTALGFIKRGFEVIVLSDCSASRSEENFKVAMDFLSKAGCMIMTYEAFIYSIIGTTNHENIEELLKIINEEYDKEPSDDIIAKEHSDEKLIEAKQENMAYKEDEYIKDIKDRDEEFVNIAQNEHYVNIAQNKEFENMAQNKENAYGYMPEPAERIIPDSFEE